MTTNLQMGIAYAIGAAKAKGGPIGLDEALGPDYSAYDISYGTQVHGKEYVLYKDLSKEAKRLASIYDAFSLNQIVHVMEEMVIYDMKKN